MSARRLPRGVVRVIPAAGRESVWDKWRPPRLESSSQPVVVLGGAVPADSRPTFRVLETSHLPGYDIPVADWHPGTPVAATGLSVCKRKGAARLFDIHGGGRIARRATWGHQNPTPPVAALADCVSAYPALMDRCEVGGVAVDAREGDVWGDSVTPDIVGPFTGAPGTWGW